LATITELVEREQDESGVNLAKIVQVGRRFLRSVNLERDFYSPNSLDGYVLTPAALSTLERLALAIDQPSARAWSITGAYGTGKSAFALMATKILAGASLGDTELRARLRQQEPEIASHLFSDAGTGFWPVLVTGAREPIIRALLRGLQESLRHLPEMEARLVQTDLEKIHPSPWEAEGKTGRDVAVLVEHVSRLVRQHLAGCAGLIVVIDEMGKFLEYAAQHSEKGDMQVLQEMAEQATRSRENPVLLITILHQAFEEYGHRLSSSQRVEWQKVQGRFVDVPFGDSPEETLRMLAQAIEQANNADADTWLADTLKAQMEDCRHLRIIPQSLSAAEFRELLRQTYPLHPVTALVLPTLFRRFGQNERSLFSFLSSEEPFGFQEFLRGHLLSPAQVPLLRLDHLYDYVVRALGSSLYSHATAKLWAETDDALHRLRDRAPLQARLVKTIGLLSILGDQVHVTPSRETLLFALAGEGVTRQEVEAAISDLEVGTLITYRHFKKAYRLYEGSDVDIESRLREARAFLTRGTDSVKMAHLLGATPPLVARRHSYETGTLRFFEVRCCRPETLTTEVRAGHSGADGLLLLCLASDPSEISVVEGVAQENLSTQPEVLIGVNVESPALHEAATLVESLLWVQEHTPELRNDRVASREVAERLLDAMTAFRTEWERLLRPQGAVEEGGVWLHQGNRVPLTSYRQLQALVSSACDDAYPHTPRLRNELINRRQLSSAAAGARRNLIEGLIERRHTDRLGIEGFPPEASIYASVLKSTGIHYTSDGETFEVGPPDQERDPALAQVWGEIEDFLFGGTLEARALTTLNARLRAKPYGLADGLVPLLLCAVLLYHEDEVVVYEDGRFITELDTATYERLIKRPENFSLQGCRVAGERRAVLDRFAKGLLRPGTDTTLVNVVRELYRQFNRLPEYTIKTRQLSPEAQALRSVFKEGKEPEQLLFVNLPQVLNTHPFRSDEIDTANVELFFTRWNETMTAIMGAYDALLARLERTLCGRFGVADWSELKARALDIRPLVTEIRLKAFVTRAADEIIERQKWLESVAAGVVGRPPNTWSDAEEERFAGLLPPLVSAFQHSELLWFERNERGTSTEYVGVRLAITQETGSEEARVAVVSKAEAANITDLTKALLHMFEAVMKGKSQDLRVAVISQVAQEVLKSNNHE
jgi:hypothetical protein